MKLITEKEFNAIQNQRKAPGPLLIAIKSLKVGEGLFVSTSEWQNKTQFSSYIGNYRKRLDIGLKTKKVLGKGWVILRTH